MSHMALFSSAYIIFSFQEFFIPNGTVSKIMKKVLVMKKFK